jgi:CRP-like cAMP-binding protein
MGPIGPDGETPGQRGGGTVVETGTPLGNVALFRDLPDGVLAQIEAGSRLCHYDAGDSVCEGKPDHGVFAILGGQVEVIHRGSPTGTVLVAKVGAGECVGEFVAIAGVPASAVVRASAPTVVLEIPQNLFRHVITSHPEVLLRLTAHLVAIIRSLNQRLANLGHFDSEVRRIQKELFRFTV